MKKLAWATFLLLITSPLLQATEVKKEQWISAMTVAIPTALCTSSQYFRQCFKISAIECEETAASSTRVCLNKLRKDIPDVLQQPHDGTAWGAKLGQCAGTAFELALVNKKISSPRCNDASYWQ